MSHLAWTPPTQIRVDRTSYRARLGPRGHLELWIENGWRTHLAFEAYDDASAQMIAENLVHRYTGAPRGVSSRGAEE